MNKLGEDFGNRKSKSDEKAKKNYNKYKTGGPGRAKKK